MLLLAYTDTLLGTLSGLATKKLMERAYGVFGDIRYQRLATISVAHLYNLRQHPGYQHQRQVWTKTRPTTVPIGERRAPAPNNRPGYLRVDSVHQGDQDGLKGVYHINAVDCVTQYEGVATCERISEAFLIPVLEALLQSFPFVILGFYTDNGSEYINRDVAKLLNKLLIEEQTKSRSRHSNDNAQAESKNGAIENSLFLLIYRDIENVSEPKTTKVPDSHRVKNAVEVVALVLHYARMETFHPALETPPAFVMALVVQALPARHPTTHAGYRKTAFPALLFLIAEGRQHRIDQHRLRHRRRVRIARIRLAAEDHHAQIDADLRRGKPGSVQMRHGIAHVLQ